LKSFEINNLIYSYLGKSNTAVIIEEHFDSILDNCENCDTDFDAVDRHNNTNICEYCHAEELGIEVFKCSQFGFSCCNRTYNYTDFNNSEVGLFCDDCVDEEDEEDEDN
jgi:hypothetical protein